MAVKLAWSTWRPQRPAVLPPRTPRTRSHAVPGAQMGTKKGKNSQGTFGKPGDMSGKEGGCRKPEFPGHLPFKYWSDLTLHSFRDQSGMAIYAGRGRLVASRAQGAAATDPHEEIPGYNRPAGKGK